MTTRGQYAQAPTSFATRTYQFIRRETGIVMNVHLFRHMAVKLHLDAHPNDLETVRRLLGHSSLATTTRNYTELNTAAAFRRHDAVNIIQAVLGHGASKTAERHYNLAGSLEASRRYAGTLGQLRQHAKKAR